MGSRITVISDNDSVLGEFVKSLCTPYSMRPVCFPLKDKWIIEYSFKFSPWLLDIFDDFCNRSFINCRLSVMLLRKRDLLLMAESIHRYQHVKNVFIGDEIPINNYYIYWVNRIIIDGYMRNVTCRLCHQSKNMLRTLCLAIGQNKYITTAKIFGLPRKYNYISNVMLKNRSVYKGGRLNARHAARFIENLPKTKNLYLLTSYPYIMQTIAKYVCLTERDIIWGL